MTTERMIELLSIADREQVESVVRAHAMLRDRSATAMMLDEREQAILFQHLGGTQVPVVAAVEVEARGFIARAQQLLMEVDGRLEQLMAVITTPPRTAHLGRSWISELDKIDEMIATAQTLQEAPEWKGTAAEAHLTAIPAQIEALRSLRSQAVTAGESVIAVGALQNTIFEASALLMVAAAVQIDVQPPGGTVPMVLYRRTIGLVNILGALVDALDQQFSGEGTWKQSAQDLSDGLEEATAGIGFEWPKAVREEDPGPREKGDDHPGRSGEHPHPGGPGAEDEDPDDSNDDAGSDDDSPGRSGEHPHPGGPGAEDEDPDDSNDGPGSDDDPSADEDGPSEEGSGSTGEDGDDAGEPGESGEAGDQESGEEPADPDTDPAPVEDDPDQPAPDPAPAEPDPAPEPDPVPEPEPAPVGPEPQPDPVPVPPEPAPVEPQPVPEPDPAPLIPAEPAAGTGWQEPAPVEPVDPKQAAWEEDQRVANEDAWDRIYEDRELAKDSLGRRTLMP